MSDAHMEFSLGDMVWTVHSVLPEGPSPTIEIVYTSLTIQGRKLRGLVSNITPSTLLFICLLLHPISCFNRKK